MRTPFARIDTAESWTPAVRYLSSQSPLCPCVVHVACWEIAAFRRALLFGWAFGFKPQLAALREARRDKRGRKARSEFEPDQP